MEAMRRELAFYRQMLGMSPNAAPGAAAPAAAAPAPLPPQPPPGGEGPFGAAFQGGLGGMATSAIPGASSMQQLGALANTPLGLLIQRLFSGGVPSLPANIQAPGFSRSVPPPEGQ
jgi:hypothetical protein